MLAALYACCVLDKFFFHKDSVVTPQPNIHTPSAAETIPFMLACKIRRNRRAIFLSSLLSGTLGCFGSKIIEDRLLKEAVCGYLARNA